MTYCSMKVAPQQSNPNNGVVGAYPNIHDLDKVMNVTMRLSIKDGISIIDLYDQVRHEN